MNPGRYLDALVAEKVMGLKLKNPQPESKWWKGRFYLEMDSKGADVKVDSLGYWHELVPEYSTDIAAAWKVVEKLGLEDDWNIAQTSGGWRVWLCISVEPAVCAKTLPHAISEYALRIKKRGYII